MSPPLELSEAEEATKKADQARLTALTASREVAQATMPLRRMRNLKLREEERLADVERSIASADSIEAKEAAEAAKAIQQPKLQNSKPNWLQLKPNYNRRSTHWPPRAKLPLRPRQHALKRRKQRMPSPAPQSRFRSLLVARIQRLYVRQAFEPMFDIPVTIRDPDLPIGTHVFTALERGGGKGDMQWSVVSLVGSNVGMPRRHTKRLMPPPTKRIYQAPKRRSTASSYPRTRSIGSRRWCPHDRPSSFQMKGQAPKQAAAPSL